MKLPAFSRPLPCLTAFALALTLLAPVFFLTPARAQSYTFTTLAGSAPQSGSADGVGSNARFNTPYSTAVDAAGNVYVADRSNHLIRRITPAGIVSTVAGLAETSGSADGTGSAARFNLPTGVAVDGTGNVFVADNANHTIRKITAAGAVTTFAGLAGTTGSADGTGSTARFNFPFGLALDPDGNLFVSDRSNRTIRKITSAGVVSTLAGLAGTGGGTDGAGTNARFNFPSGIALDGAGNLFIADSNNYTIRKLTSAGLVSTIAGSPLISGNTNAVGAAARFNLPNGIAVDSAGNILVADTSNEAIRKIAPDGTVTTYAGNRGIPGSADGTGTGARFFRPFGITLDAAGNAYVSDSYNHMIRKVTSVGVVSTIAGPGAGLGSYGSIDGTGNAARFNAPRSIALDGSGNLFATDTGNSTIRRITPTGTVSTFAGFAGLFSFSDGSGNSALFNFPTGISSDGRGQLLVSDSSNNVIRAITTAGVVSTIAGSAGISGSTDGTGTVARFNFPQGLATDRDGNSYLADNSNHTIRKVTASGVVTTIAGSPGVSGSANGVGSAARFNFPYGTALDSAGNLYVADWGNSTIRKIAPDGTVSTLAGSAGVTGSTDGTGATARFNSPTGIATDPDGNIYVTEANNHDLRKITPAGVVTTIGGQSTQFGSRDGTGANAIFFWPTALAIDASGAIYMLDAANNVIVKGVLDTPPAVIALSPSLTLSTGSSVTLAVNATGGGLAYQWRFNGTAIPGATASTYAIARAGPAAIGDYTVAITNSAGTATSAATSINVITTDNVGRITNLAIRSQAGTGAQTLIVGVAVGGAGTTGAKPVLLRAVGPTLGVFGVPGVLADPKLELFSGSTKINENDDWAGNAQVTAIGAAVGAFALGSAASKDAALYNPTFASGSYSVQITGGGGATGVALAEIYDATAPGTFGPATPRLTNVSARTQVGTGGDILIAGFTIGGLTAKTVLLRAIGPSLTAFGVPGALADPKLELFSGSTKINENDDWGGATSTAATFLSVGAFPLVATSKDAVLLVTLAPGGYTAQVTGVNNTTGVALIEVYEVP